MKHHHNTSGDQKLNHVAKVLSMRCAKEYYCKMKTINETFDFVKKIIKVVLLLKTDARVFYVRN
jgi:hypothetical protein